MFSHMALLRFFLYCGEAILLLLVVVWLGVTLFIYSRHRRYAHIPSPEMPSFYMGHLATAVKWTKKERHIHHLLMEWCKDCGPLYVWFAMHKPIVMVMKPEDIKEVLLSSKVPKEWDSYRTIAYIFGERFMGHGLVTVPDYSSWRPQRSLYDPFFTKSHLRTLLPVFNECVDQFVERLRPKADGKTQVKLLEEFSDLTLHVISKVAFGSDFSQPWSDKDLGLKYTKTGGRLSFLLEHLVKGTSFVKRRNPLYTYLHPRETESYREAVRAVRMIGRDCIMKRIKALEDGEIVPNDILTQILKIAKTEDVELEDLVDGFVTFYFAGQETTSLLVSFAVIVLQWHPDILQRVLDEISEVLGGRKVVTAEDLDQLKYMDMVLLETLRMYPPAPATVREATAGMKLSGYEIPKGTMLHVNFYANHHNPQNFEDPEIFDPNRFGPQREKPSPLIYHPFSEGHRGCIGKVFALMEAKIILCYFLTAFKVYLPEGYKIEFAPSSMLKPNDGLPCTLECTQ